MNRLDGLKYRECGRACPTQTPVLPDALPDRLSPHVDNGRSPSALDRARVNSKAGAQEVH